MKIGTAAIIGFGLKKVMKNSHMANLALVALGANLIADAVAEFKPLGLYPGMGVYTGNGAGRGLGYYPQRQLSGGPVVFGNNRPFVGIDGGAGVPMLATQDPFRAPF